ncbi:MAG: hypothetical protein H7210_08520 [Pyrinomonadaceae bacterium]|nr:hypothetical protein [Phycisphaerales bacterium]
MHTDAGGLRNLDSDPIPKNAGWKLLYEAHATNGTQVAGFGLINGKCHAYRYTLGQSIVEIPSLPGEQYVGGDSCDGSGLFGRYSAEAINKWGDVVGSVQTGGYPIAGFFYSDATGMVNLQSLIDPSLQLTIVTAVGINDNREIVGYMYKSGDTRARAYKLKMTDLLACPAADQCHNAGTRDLGTGACTYTDKPDQSPCDDGERCTQADVCLGGNCTSENPVLCPASNVCFTAQCERSTGACGSEVPLPEGTPCGDAMSCRGNSCTPDTLMFDELALEDEEVFGAISKASDVATKLYTGLTWLNCQVGSFCPESEVHREATRIISTVTDLIVKTVVDSLLGRLQTLFDESERLYGNTANLTPEIENGLIVQTNSLYNDFSQVLDNTDPRDPAQADLAYQLAPMFNIMAALADQIYRTAIIRNRVPISPTWPSTQRLRTQETNYTLVGTNNLWYQCPGNAGLDTRVDTEQNFDNSFITKKLIYNFANAVFRVDHGVVPEDCQDCNLARQLVSPGSRICTRNSRHCWFGVICKACVVSPNSAGIWTGVPLVKARIAQDPVVATVRAAMVRMAGRTANSLGLRFNSFSEPHCGSDRGTIKFDTGPFVDRDYGTRLVDWDPGFNKGHCVGGFRMLGLSKYPLHGITRSVLCQVSGKDFPGSIYTEQHTDTLSALTASWRRGWRIADWDPGFIQHECGYHEYVSGASQDPVTHQFHGVMCASGQVPQNPVSCYRRLFDGSNAAGDGDWDPGMEKAECSPSEYIAGVSVDPVTTDPHAILCCPEL